MFTESENEIKKQSERRKSFFYIHKDERKLSEFKAHKTACKAVKSKAERNTDNLLVESE